jgi:hypothetical protein
MTINTADYAAFKLHSRRCTVCRHPERDNIDLMLVGEERSLENDERMTYDEIISFANASGPTISRAALGRHYNNHVKPSWQTYLETQRQMDAIAEATGRKLTLPSVFTNILISKGLKMLDRLDDDDLAELNPVQVLRLMNDAARNALHLERAEALLTKQTVQEIDEKLTSKLNEKGISPEILATIREQVYGLIPQEDA